MYIVLTSQGKVTRTKFADHIQTIFSKECGPADKIPQRVTPVNFVRPDQIHPDHIYSDTALHVHCLVHSLNLCLQDTSHVCSYIRDTLHLVMELVQLIKWSPKRTSLFEQLKEEMSPETHSLRPLCPTRWTLRTAAIHAIISNYETLYKVLDEVHSSGRHEYAMKAGRYLQQMEKFSTYFGLNLGYLVLV